MSLGVNVDLFGSQSEEQFGGEIAEEGVPQPVYPLKVLKQEDQPFQVRRVELAINAVERVGDGVGDFLGLKVLLQVKDVVLDGGNLAILRLGNPPNQ